MWSRRKDALGMGCDLASYGAKAEPELKRKNEMNYVELRLLRANLPVGVLSLISHVPPYLFLISPSFIQINCRLSVVNQRNSRVARPSKELSPQDSRF